MLYWYYHFTDNVPDFRCIWKVLQYRFVSFPTWSHTNFFVCYIVLPVLSQPPTVVDVSSDTVTLEWTAWDPDTEEGDPPVVGYIVYVNIDRTGGWGERVDHSTTSTTLRNLQANTSYEFRVAAMREGKGGFGQPSPPTYATTLPTGKGSHIIYLQLTYLLVNYL